ncbi:MAG: calcium/sodium antiporter [Spirochaetia bacterium]|nr:calcium/sodium antiporter [Spirochaetia bacterium]
MNIIYFLLGLILLVIGAEFLVRGASRLSFALGISPLVIGLTVVAFGTSSPELAVSVISAIDGKAGLSLGNVVGSNIFNILFILGISAMIIPLSVAQQIIRFDVPIMIGLSFLLLIVSLDGNISRIDGIIFILGLLLYTFYIINKSRSESKNAKEEIQTERIETKNGSWEWIKNSGLVISGLILLVVGSEWLVDSSITFAKMLGVSEIVIGLTIVAVGTSLPELVTSIVASIKGERDIAVGNVIGSNIFNIMGVLGLSSIIPESGIAVSPSFIGFDLPIMIAVAFSCLPIFISGGRISRFEGFLFFGYYIMYTTYLVLKVTGHDKLEKINSLVIYYVLPLTVVTLLVISFQEYKKRIKPIG